MFEPTWTAATWPRVAHIYTHTNGRSFRVVIVSSPLFVPVLLGRLNGQIDVRVPCVSVCVCVRARPDTDTRQSLGTRRAKSLDSRAVCRLPSATHTNICLTIGGRHRAGSR